MFTLFDLIRLLAIVGGAAVLGIIGWDKLGIVGCAIGIPVGLILGGMIGQLPLMIGLKWMSRRFDRMTDDELLAELHDTNCFTPNVHLLELSRRGYDIQRELPYVHSLLASTEMHRRTAGWAALTSAFPDLADKIAGYNPTAQTDDCQMKCKPLLDATESGSRPHCAAPTILQTSVDSWIG
jgi:hypothetical protein